MVGTTAQLIALVCHFNARAQGLRAGPFFPTNTTCRFCDFVHFARTKPSRFSRTPKPAVVAQTPDDWMDQEARPARRAILVYRPSDSPPLADHLSVAFVGGGGDWHIALIEGSRASIWKADWESGSQGWKVTYSEIGQNVELSLQGLPSPAELASDFRRTLAALLEFCSRHKLDNWHRIFVSASEALSDEDPGVMADLAPEGLLSLPAKQLLAASQTAWVFGGMGSWNDLGFDGQEHDRY